MSTVKHDNRGYVGSSLSRRAAAAYDDGERPLTKWRKADADAYATMLGRFNIPATLTVTEYRAILARFGLTSRHHTSKYANLTNFYHPAATILAFCDLDDDEHDYRPIETIRPGMLNDPERAFINAGIIANFLIYYRSRKDNH